MSIKNPDLLTVDLGMAFNEQDRFTDLPNDIETRLNEAHELNHYVKPEFLAAYISKHLNEYVINMPMGTYTSKSFDSNLVKLLKNHTISFNMSHIIDATVPVSAHYYNCVIIDCNLNMGGLIECGNLYDSSLLDNHRIFSFNRDTLNKKEEYRLLIDGMAIMDSSISNGAYITNSNIINSNTSDACFAHGCTVQRGLHASAYVEENGLKIINGRDSLIFNEVVKEHVLNFNSKIISNQNSIGDESTKTVVRLSSYTQYLPIINYYNPIGIDVMPQGFVEDINDKASYGKKRKFDDYDEEEVSRLLKSIYVYANTNTLQKVNGVDVGSIYFHKNNSIDVAKVNDISGQRDVLGVSKNSSEKVKLLKHEYEQFMNRIDELIIDDSEINSSNSYLTVKNLSSGSADIFGAVAPDMYNKLKKMGEVKRLELARAVADERSHLKDGNSELVQQDIFIMDDAIDKNAEVSVGLKTTMETAEKVNNSTEKDVFDVSNVQLDLFDVVPKNEGVKQIEVVDKDFSPC